MIRKVLLSTVAIVAIGGTAFAADLPSRRAPPVYVPPPIPVFSWTGFYVGGQVGTSFGRDAATQTSGHPVSFNVGEFNGLIGGGHVGYNFSTQGLPVLGGFGGAGGVIGIEGDADGTDERSRFGGLPTFLEQTHVDFEASVRGRIGVAVDRALFYATGGAAFADIRDDYQTGTKFQQLDKTRVGWTVGAGMEYALTTQWSLRGEYRYSDFGTYTDVNGKALGVGFNTTHKFTTNRVQVGFSYKFDTPVAVPVVARY